MWSVFLNSESCVTDLCLKVVVFVVVVVVVVVVVIIIIM
jgi:hypothetical protein